MSRSLGGYRGTTIYNDTVTNVGYAYESLSYINAADTYTYGENGEYDLVEIVNGKQENIDENTNLTCNDITCNEITANNIITDNTTINDTATINNLNLTNGVISDLIIKDGKNLICYNADNTDFLISLDGTGETLSLKLNLINFYTDGYASASFNNNIASFLNCVVYNVLTCNDTAVFNSGLNSNSAVNIKNATFTIKDATNTTELFKFEPSTGIFSTDCTSINFITNGEQTMSLNGDTSTMINLNLSEDLDCRYITCDTLTTTLFNTYSINVTNGFTSNLNIKNGKNLICYNADNTTEILKVDGTNGTITSKDLFINGSLSATGLVDFANDIYQSAGSFRSSTFFINDTNGYIGINTLAPSVLLDVNGTLNATTANVDTVNITDLNVDNILSPNVIITDLSATTANISNELNINDHCIINDNYCRIISNLPNAPTLEGVYIGKQSNNIGIQLSCDTVSDVTYIDFSTKNGDYLGRILYSPSTKQLKFYSENIISFYPSSATPTDPDTNTTEHKALHYYQNYDTDHLLINSTRTNKEIKFNNPLTGSKMQMLFDSQYLNFLVDGQNIMKLDAVGGVNINDYNLTTTGTLNCHDLACTNITAESLTFTDTILDTLNAGNNAFVVNSSKYVYAGANSVLPSQSSTRGVYLGCDSTSNAGVQIISEGATYIDFSGINTDFKARILANNTTLKYQTYVNETLAHEIDSSLNHDFKAGDITTTGDLSCGALTCSAFESNSNFKINSNSILQATPTESGIQAGFDGANVGLSLTCESTSNVLYIDFGEKNQDYRGRIRYDVTQQRMRFFSNNTETLQMTDSTSDFKNTDITTTGDVTCANVNGNVQSCTGQIFSYIGEKSTSLTSGAFQFCYGNGKTSSNGKFGVNLSGFCNWKILNCTYDGWDDAYTYTTSTKLVFRFYLDGVAQNWYFVCDFSDTSYGSAALKQFSYYLKDGPNLTDNDIQPTITPANYGATISIETYSVANDDNAQGHRLIFNVMNTSAMTIL